MTNLDQLVLKETDQERPNDFHADRRCRPCEYVSHAAIMFTVQVHVESVGSVRHYEYLLEGVKDGHRDLREVDDACR